ncbi:MAG: hypothetical protein AAGA48_36875 [Myxococcota bacterium]
MGNLGRHPGWLSIALDWCLDHLNRWPIDERLGVPIDTERRHPDAIAAELLERITSPRWPR